MEGIIGSPNWEACEKCAHHTDDGCQEEIEVYYNAIADAIICENYMDVGE